MKLGLVSGNLTYMKMQQRKAEEGQRLRGGSRAEQPASCFFPLEYLNLMDSYTHAEA